MLKAICIIVLITCICLMIYSIVNAIRVNKRTKAAEARSETIFLAQMRQEEKKRLQQNDAGKPSTLVQPFTTIQPYEPEKKKTLDYDKYENEVDMETVDDKHLKDFFKAD